MRIFSTLLILIMLAVTVSFAQVARLVHYEGELKNAEGETFSGTTDITVGIFRSPLSEEPVWTETHTNVEVNDGQYSLMLGSQNPLNLSFYEYFLEASTPDFPTEAGRKMIVGSGYNYRMWFLFSAYTIVWLAIFIYMVTISNRQKKLINELTLIDKLQKEKAA